MAWPQSYRSATSVHIQFFSVFLWIAFLCYETVTAYFIFFMYSYIFIQWDAIVFHVIPRISKYTYENGVTWQNSGFFIFCKSNFEQNWFYEVDLIKIRFEVKWLIFRWV
jgi:hypothetical protein